MGSVGFMTFFFFGFGFIYFCFIIISFNVVLMWKIVEASKPSVLYIYIYIYIERERERERDYKLHGLILTYFQLIFIFKFWYFNFIFFLI